MTATSKKPRTRGRPAGYAAEVSERVAGLPHNTAVTSQNRPLTQLQRSFIKHWAAGESITSAALRAGYNDNAAAAYQLVKRPEVLALYQEEKRKYEEAAGMTRKKVMDGLLEAVEMAKLLAEPSTMVAGWREIGKMCGYYEPVQKKVDITLNGNVVMERMNKLSDAELLRLIQQEIKDEATEEEDD
jgi:phage terminase small subunit